MSSQGVPDYSFIFPQDRILISFYHVIGRNPDNNLLSFNIQMASRLHLLPFLGLVAAYPPGYIQYLKDFPEARNFADFTLFQTAKGIFYKVGFPF